MLVATTHKNTDFDGLASVIAATLLYPGCVGVIPKETNRNVSQFLSTHKTAFNLLLPNQIDPDEVTKLVVVDTDQWQRLDRMERLRQRKDLVIDLWDHHMAVQGDIKSTWSCKENAGSTVTLLVREMKKREIRLTPLESTVMIIGLYEDTGQLTYPSTSSEDALAAAFLLENKADLNVANFFLNPPYEEIHKKLLFTMIEKTEIETVRGLRVGFNCVRLDQRVQNLASVVSMYRKIINVNALFVVFSWDEQSHTVIGRSEGEGINVGKILQHFSGGGHAGAGSAIIKSSDKTPEGIVEEILFLIQNTRGESATIADIMSFPVVGISADTRMKEVREIMSQQKIRGILVMEEESILGIIVLGDLRKIKQQRQWDSPVKAFMSRDVFTITPQTSPSMAAMLMKERDIGYLPVMQDDKPIGIVSRTDILTYYYDLLPE
ncbi:MAG: hypothetical protein CSB23_02870 [Deltaproteobacteria bacterium]|nr:MAG: hypothetical protein CSB23_02870 [Deltaproteobacteria bacterium]